MTTNNTIPSLSANRNALPATDPEKTPQTLNREGLAEYLSEMINELKFIAQDANFPFLAYLLDMAKDEALSEIDKARWSK